MGIWFSWYNIPLALISLSWKGLAFDSPFLHNFLSFSVIISVGRIDDNFHAGCDHSTFNSMERSLYSFSLRPCSVGLGRGLVVARLS
jgi:hypothetical protein